MIGYLLILSIGTFVAAQSCEPGNDCCLLGGQCGDAAFDDCTDGNWDYDIGCEPSYQTCCLPDNPTTSTTTPVTTSGTGSTTSPGPTTSSGPSTTGAPPTECGWRPILPENGQDQQIVGGYESVPHSWPWMAALETDYFEWGDWEHHCGASVIAEQWVLTAAHCIAKSGITEPQYYRLILGMHHQDPALQTGEEIYIHPSATFVHPEYDTELDGSPFDVALLKLETPITYTDHIRPVCLPDNSNQTFLDDDCFITGWGLTKDTTPEGVLNESPIGVITNELCDYKWETGSGRVGLIKDNHICAGNGVPGTCNGDSGGPLNCKQDGRWIIAGATSFGAAGCVAEEAPDVYTRLSHFIDWINDTMNNN